jgi:phosphoribosyl 1,2-cyclic phosphodiesterase
MKNYLQVIGSGSSGNCLAIKSNNKTLLVDLGVNYKDVISAVNYNIEDWTCALVTHLHRDHSKSVNELYCLGIPIYGNKSVCDAFYPNCNIMPKKLQVDGFTIQHFDLVHNVPNSAFVIDTEDDIRILYCTDTQYIPKKVKGVNYAIIEANFDDEEMLDNLINDEVSRSQYQNHHSLSNCIEYLQQIYSTDLQGIILWHLSNTNINANKAVEAVKKALGFNNVTYAKKGLVMTLEKEEF